MQFTRDQKIVAGALLVVGGVYAYRRYSQSYIYGPLNGTLQGPVALGQPGPLASGEPAMGFNGKNTGITFSRPVSVGSNWTWEGWIYSSNLTGPILALSQKPGLSAQALDALYLGNFPGYGPLLGVNTAYSLTNGLITAPAQTGQWMYAVVTNTSQGLTLWVNGKHHGPISTHQNPTGSFYPTIGTANMVNWYSNTGNYFAGRLSHIAIYSTALSSTTIRAHYQAAQSRTIRAYSRTVLASQPQAYWPLTDTSGTIAHQVVGVH